MQPAEVPEFMQPQWFFPLFAVGWFAVCGVLALSSGWRSLAERFPAPAQVNGERFRFASASMGLVPWFPVRYSGCVFFTVGTAGLAMSLLFLFRFLSPPLFVPWSQVASVEEKAGFFGRRAVVRFKNSAVVLTLYGRAASSVTSTHAKAHAAVAP